MTIPRPRRKFPLTKQRRLLSQLQDAILRVGAVPTPDMMYQFQLQTRAGLLRLSLAEGILLISVHTRFDETQRAVTLLGASEINRCSGKWNHYFNEQDCDDGDAVDNFLHRLRRVL